MDLLLFCGTRNDCLVLLVANVSSAVSFSDAGSRTDSRVLGSPRICCFAFVSLGLSAVVFLVSPVPPRALDLTAGWVGFVRVVVADSLEQRSFPCVVADSLEQLSWSSCLAVCLHKNALVFILCCI